MVQDAVPALPEKFPLGPTVTVIPDPLHTYVPGVHPCAQTTAKEATINQPKSLMPLFSALEPRRYSDQRKRGRRGLRVSTRIGVAELDLVLVGQPRLETSHDVLSVLASPLGHGTDRDSRTGTYAKEREHHTRRAGWDA